MGDSLLHLAMGLYVMTRVLLCPHTGEMPAIPSMGEKRRSGWGLRESGSASVAKGVLPWRRGCFPQGLRFPTLPDGLLPWGTLVGLN